MNVAVVYKIESSGEETMMRMYVGAPTFEFNYPWELVDPETDETFRFFISDGAFMQAVFERKLWFEAGCALDFEEPRSRAPDNTRGDSRIVWLPVISRVNRLYHPVEMSA